MTFRVVFGYVCLFLATSVWAQTQSRTCWYKQLNGLIETKRTVELDTGSLVFETFVVEFAFDEIFQAQSYIWKETFDNGTIREGKLIFLFEKGLVYAIDINGGVETCVSAQISTRFNRRCIPERAVFVETLKFGDDALLGNAWAFSSYIDNKKINVTHFVTEECVPITSSIIEEDFSFDPPKPKVTTVGYYDIKLGICDPDKFFKVPDICERGDLSTSFAGTKMKHHFNLMDQSYKL